MDFNKETEEIYVKDCQFCGEEIKDEAIYCRFCNKEQEEDNFERLVNIRHNYMATQWLPAMISILYCFGAFEFYNKRIDFFFEKLEVFIFKVFVVYLVWLGASIFMLKKPEYEMREIDPTKLLQEVKEYRKDYIFSTIKNTIFILLLTFSLWKLDTSTPQMNDFKVFLQEDGRYKYVQKLHEEELRLGTLHVLSNENKKIVCIGALNSFYILNDYFSQEMVDNLLKNIVKKCRLKSWYPILDRN